MGGPMIPELTSLVAEWTYRVMQVASPLSGHYEYVLGLQVYHHTVHSEAEMRDRVFHAPTRIEVDYLPELRGAHLAPYVANPHGHEWVKVTDRCYAPTPERFVTGPRILLREIPGNERLAAALYAEQAYANKAVILVRTLSARPALAYLLAVLNSGLMYRYFLATSEKSRQALFPRLSLTTVRNLPIRIVDFSRPTASPVEQDLLSSCASALESGDYDAPLALASQALAAHAALHGPAGKPELRDDPYWREVIAGADTSFPGREDFVHDLLAALAQRMMDLNRDKHAETDRFVAWLERELRIEVEDLTRKTHIKGYPEADFTRLQEALQANRRKLALPVDGLFGAQLSDEYEKSMALLRPLQEALTNTDRLIDQIVYRLYGLTEEEIAVVEGNA